MKDFKYLLTAIILVTLNLANAQQRGIGLGTINVAHHLDATFGDSGFVALGNFGSGPVINLNPAGTRLLWYPRKAAFRAGFAQGDQWSNNRIGDYSAAFGYNNVANSIGAFASGVGSTAGYASVAIGQVVQASSSAAAFGGNTRALGNFTLAANSGTTASADASTALGWNTSATAYGSLVIGRWNEGGGTLNSWVDTDAVLEVGNGTSHTTRRNTLTMLKNGTFTLRGRLTEGNPYSGNLEGVTLRWIPLKAAFRAGQATGTEWSDAETGYYSVALGRNTRASGFVATALGDGTLASGGASLAVGFSTEATGEQAVAMGINSKAIGYHSFAISGGTASGSQAIALGGTASGNFSLTRNSIASGASSIALGTNAQAIGTTAIALGRQSIAQGTESFACGSFALSKGENAIALGYQAEANGYRSLAAGYFAKANNQDAISMGNQTVANGFVSLSTGILTRASGDQASTFGYGTVARAYRSMAIGSFNDSVAGSSLGATVATDPAFIVGNGTADNMRSNALILYKNGNLTIAGTLTQSSDARLKKDVERIDEDAIEKLEQLNGYHYHWKNEVENPGLQTGLIAQEVKEVFPELVIENNKGEMSVNYSGMIPYLVEAIKSQQQTINDLQNEIKKMKKNRR